MCPCRPATLHTREGQPALWEFPRDHRGEGRPRHHHRQLRSLPTHSQLRLRFHHQRQRSGGRQRRLGRGPGGRRVGPHDHRHQQRHRSARLQYGPGGRGALTRWIKGGIFSRSRGLLKWTGGNELSGSDEGDPQHWPKIVVYCIFL